MAITDRTLQSIKQAPLSKVIEALGGGLKRVGHEFLTQCPWHDDTNPSLTVNDQKGFCFCHVCRGGGDAISYIRQTKGLGMRDAAEMAAGLLGVTFETDDESPEVAARKRAEREAALAKVNKKQEQYRKNWTDPRCARARQQWM